MCTILANELNAWNNFNFIYWILIMWNDCHGTIWWLFIEYKINCCVHQSKYQVLTMFIYLIEKIKQIPLPVEKMPQFQ